MGTGSRGSEPRDSTRSSAEPGARRLPQIRAAEAWTPARAEGGGPFVSRLTWALPSGGEAVWESRPARKRATIAVRAASGTKEATPAAAGVARRLRRLNWVAAGAFAVGGSLFALGATVAQIGSGNATTAASIYFAGGLFFNTGGYASLLGVINAPRSVGAAGSEASEQPWRWWSYEPERIDWASTFALLVGTLAFGISLIDAFLDGLTTHEQNRLIWRPEMIGCILFLVSGHLAMTEICHRGRPCLRRRDLGWWIVAINQLGSILFLVSAVAGFVRPETSSEVNVAVANWGTLTGALCFAIGGAMQAFERPPVAPPRGARGSARTTP